MLTKIAKIALLTSVFLFTSAMSIAEDLLQKADIAYGEYLAGECVTCHSADGADRGIPSIIGLDAEGFAYIMHSYRKKSLIIKLCSLLLADLMMSR